MYDTPELSAVDALAAVIAGHGALLDVREEHEWARGHSPLATLIPMSRLRSRIDEVPSDRQLFVVCHSGQRSARVTDALVAAGLDAANVAGGMVAWQAAGGEIVSDGAEAPRVD